MYTFLENELSFKEVVLKSQEKKNVQKTSYKTRYEGPLPPFK